MPGKLNLLDNLPKHMDRMCTLLARFMNICLLLTSDFDSFEGNEVIVIGLREDGAAEGGAY